jgi:hypothetical protein
MNALQLPLIYFQTQNLWNEYKQREKKKELRTKIHQSRRKSNFYLKPQIKQIPVPVNREKTNKANINTDLHKPQTLIITQTTQNPKPNQTQTKQENDHLQKANHTGGQKMTAAKKARESFKTLKSFSFHSTKPQNHNQYHVPFPNTVTTRPSHQTSS